MEGTHFGYDMLLGIQAGIPAGKYFRLNPFAILGGASPGNRMSYNYQVRTNRSGQEFGPIVSIQRGDKINPAPMLGSFGVNLIFKPWGLSFNLTSSFLKKGVIPEKDLENIEITTFSLSYSFGKYQK